MTAEKWVSKIIASVSQLNRFPEMGSPVEDLDFPGIRELIVGSYRVLYHFDGSACRIGKILRAEQDNNRAVTLEDFL